MTTETTDAPVRALDATQPQKVSYAIPLWLRDEQIRVNISLLKERIEPHYEVRDQPIAVVCYGPSLNDTWEEIRNFEHVITCSGAHRFLIDRGIIPNFHCEVDPREHKLQLIGEPHKDVEYLIASTCHPKYFRRLVDGGFNVKLWHVFDGQDEAMRVLPPGEWALTGGCSVGLRALAIAHFLGFRDLHIFAMDGSEGASGKHAAAHPNQAKQFYTTEYKGVTYRTTPAILEAARQTWHELNLLKDVRATFYGEGLVQAMAKDYVRESPKSATLLAFNKPELISAEYRELNAKLHDERLDYGVGGGKHADIVIKLRDSVKATSVLDYGAGKGYLAKALPFPIWEYDPAIPGKDISPRPADLVVCTDVLEHVEPDRLHFVLGDLARCVLQFGYFVIHTGAAKKFYADGRNTHLIQQGFDWWKGKLKKHFTVAKSWPKGNELHFLVQPLAGKRKKLVGQMR
jgi:6-hydroxymethylpterin diphosphokinase MptE-like/Methyltransferase domain